MSEQLGAVDLVRKIRDDIYEQTKGMSPAELIEFFRLGSASAKAKLARVEPRHAWTRDELHER